MGLSDKISGRVKKAAGDLTGRKDLHREGQQEERKGEAKDELVRDQAQAEREQQRAEQSQATAERRADAAAERERAKAEPDLARAEKAQSKAERRANEVDQLEGRTDPGRVEGEGTKDELYAEAQDLDIKGRSDMNKDELAEEIRKHR